MRTGISVKLDPEGTVADGSRFHFFMKFNRESYRGYKSILSGSIFELFYLPGGIPDYGIDPREQSLRRARSSLKRKINANAGMWRDEHRRPFLPLFVTLTFAENIQDVPTANKCFKDFILRFNYHFFGTKKAVLKYVVVIEFQTRGAIHYHMILFNLPFIDNLSERLAEVWSFGFVMVNSIKDVKNVGAYVVKYMSKDLSDERLRGKKSYFSSRGLLKSIVSKDDFRIADMVSLLPVDSLIGSRFVVGDYWYERHFVYNSILRLIDSNVYVEGVMGDSSPIVSVAESRQDSLGLW